MKKLALFLMLCFVSIVTFAALSPKSAKKVKKSMCVATYVHYFRYSDGSVGPSAVTYAYGSTCKQAMAAAEAKMAAGQYAD